MMFNPKTEIASRADRIAAVIRVGFYGGLLLFAARCLLGCIFSHYSGEHPECSAVFFHARACDEYICREDKPTDDIDGVLYRVPAGFEESAAVHIETGDDIDVTKSADVSPDGTGEGN